MNKEEAKKECLKLNPSERFNVIDDIYDNLESRICKNCKYFNKKYEYCSLFKAIWFDNNNTKETKEIISNKSAYMCVELGEEVTFMVSKEFGCNKFERIKDE